MAVTSSSELVKRLTDVAQRTKKVQDEVRKLRRIQSAADLPTEGVAGQLITPQPLSGRTSER